MKLFPIYFIKQNHPIEFKEAQMIIIQLKSTYLLQTPSILISQTFFHYLIILYQSMMYLNSIIPHRYFIYFQIKLKLYRISIVKETFYNYKRSKYFIAFH